MPLRRVLVEGRGSGRYGRVLTPKRLIPLFPFGHQALALLSSATARRLANLAHGEQSLTCQTPQLLMYVLGRRGVFSLC
jgi:hypothetical protein